MATLTEADEGKILVDDEGEEFGIVTDVDEAANVGYFDPDPSVPEAVLAAFGRTDSERDDIRLPSDAVADVTETEVRLTDDL